MTHSGYERIVCLTEETTETLYLLGEDWRIVGISGFTVRPVRARKEKPVVSAFTKARIDEIAALHPDLVLGFSDVQADVAAQLVRRGLEVHIFNQRSVSEILRMIRSLGRMIRCGDKADNLANELAENIETVRSQQATSRRPRIYFEEWNDPLITGIGWVSELVEIAGGVDVFSELAKESRAQDRVITECQDVVLRNPDIIIGSWCGKPFKPAELATRPGWQGIAAVRNQQIHEINSSIILQPGPAALTDGLSALSTIVHAWRNRL